MTLKTEIDVLNNLFHGACAASDTFNERQLIKDSANFENQAEVDKTEDLRLNTITFQELTTNSNLLIPVLENFLLEEYYPLPDLKRLNLINIDMSDHAGLLKQV